MKRILAAAFATIGGVVLLLSYRTSLGAFADGGVDGAVSPDAAASAPTTAGSDDDGGDADPEADDDGDDESDESTSGGAAATGSTTTNGGAGPAAAASGGTDGVYTGAAAGTRFGAVQVQITVSGGRIVDVQVPAYPDSNPKDARINQQAIPQLVAATLSAQSANIQYVSGATYTSNGYVASLQSALDQAGL